MSWIVEIELRVINSQKSVILLVATMATLALYFEVCEVRLCIYDKLSLLSS